MDQNAEQQAPELDLAAEEAAFDAELAALQRGESSLNTVEQADEAEGDDSADGQNPDETTDKGSDTQSAAKKDDSQDTAPKKPEKEQTAYQKAAERQNRSWQKVNEEKAAVAAEKARLAEERRQWEAERAKTSQQSNAISPEAYERYAQEQEAKGEFALANAARTQAEARRKEMAAEAARSTTKSGYTPQEFEAEQVRSYQQTVKEIPEMADPNSSVNQFVQGMIKGEPAIAKLIDTNPHGLYFAARYAKAQASADRVPGLEKEVASLKSELQTLRSRTSPIGSPMNNSPASPRTFEDMSMEEQEAFLDRAILGR